MIGKKDKIIEVLCDPKHNIESYCRQCRKYSCEECSLKHTAHFDKLVEWKCPPKEYLSALENILYRINLLSKSPTGTDLKQAEINSKIDAAFDELVNKIRAYQSRFKTEMWYVYIYIYI